MSGGRVGKSEPISNYRTDFVVGGCSFRVDPKGLWLRHDSNEFRNVPLQKPLPLEKAGRCSSEGTLRNSMTNFARDGEEIDWPDWQKKGEKKEKEREIFSDSAIANIW